MQYRITYLYQPKNREYWLRGVKEIEADTVEEARAVFAKDMPEPRSYCVYSVEKVDES